jgi:D-3-phosphoglycerate dehydrogenase
VHTPATPETKGLLGEENLRKTKPGVMIINAARGGIVDEAALKRLLDSGHIAAAALDVFTQEPPESYELMQMEQVTATPHIAASTREAQLKVARVVAEEVLNFAMGRPVRNRVN